MKNVILLRYGEFYLKGRNKNYFENTMITNIKRALTNIKCTFIKSQCRYYIEDFEPFMLEEIISRLTKVFGLHSLSVVSKVDTNYDILASEALEYVPQEVGSFRVSVNRADKSLDKNSCEIASFLGAKILEAYPQLTVDLHHPKFEICVDIREKGFSYIFSDKILCAQGMPVGTGGRGLLLLSGGFDSPVAGWRMARRGMEIYAIHFHSYPHTSEQAKQKVKDLAQILTQYCGKIKLFCMPFTEIQESIHEHCKENYMITIMRRIMVKIAEKVAQNSGCGALITGESLGQVASQTMQSITVTNDAAKNLPIFRPLIGMDKYEIIDTATAIGTYDTSILPYEDCCTVFLPKNPLIKPELESVQIEQARIENLDELIDKCIANMEILDIFAKY